MPQTLKTLSCSLKHNCKTPRSRNTPSPHPSLLPNRSWVTMRVHRNADKHQMQSRGRHFSHENPHLNPISHFSGPNSMSFHIQLSNSWFLISHNLFLVSNFSFPISHIPLPISSFSFPTSCKKLRYDMLNYSMVFYTAYGLLIISNNLTFKKDEDLMLSCGNTKSNDNWM